MKFRIEFCSHNKILDKSHCRTLYKRKLVAQQSPSSIQNKSYFQFDKLQNKYTGKSREKKVFTQQTPFSNLASLFYLEVKPILLHSLHKQCNHVDGLFTLKKTRKLHLTAAPLLQASSASSPSGTEQDPWMPAQTTSEKLIKLHSTNLFIFGNPLISANTLENTILKL